jgi:hypothetical protein
LCFAHLIGDPMRDRLLACDRNIASIPAGLQARASPRFFCTANSPSDLTAALNAMFNHARITAHLVN